VRDRRTIVSIAALAGALLLAGCADPGEEPSYRAAPIALRDIVVGAEAAGLIEPHITVEVKSKASGEILDLPVETGDQVKRGTLLARIDQRQPRNAVALAQAELEVAQSRLAIALAQQARSQKLFAAKSIAETDFEQARLEAANAKADVIRARVAIENAQIQLDDTQVMAPIDGTIIEKNVEAGQVISSPTQDVSGGTVLLRMADLTIVRVRTLVDETDIGKLRPGIRASVSVSAYPGQRFEGELVKIEPKAITEQNVTMFPVQVRLDNPDGLLRPGMNADVEIRVDERKNVLAVPNAALVAERDVELMAVLVGASAVAAAPAGPATGTPNVRGGGEQPGPAPAPAPPGAEYVVFALREGADAPQAVRIRTGITDLDYSEVRDGLTQGDRVLLLPSSSLVRSQAEMRQRIERMTGGGLPGMRGSSR